MSQTDPPSICCRLTPGLTVERRIATALLNLTSLPEAADATRAEVTYREERVWLHLPQVGSAHSPSVPGIPDTSGPGDANPGN
jgi:hypothetical protein